MTSSMTYIVNRIMQADEFTPKLAARIFNQFMDLAAEHGRRERQVEYSDPLSKSIYDILAHHTFYFVLIAWFLPVRKLWEKLYLHHVTKVYNKLVKLRDSNSQSLDESHLKS
jgi:hypothetical protein